MNMLWIEILAFVSGLFFVIVNLFIDVKEKNGLEDWKIYAFILAVLSLPISLHGIALLLSSFKIDKTSSSILMEMRFAAPVVLFAAFFALLGFFGIDNFAKKRRGELLALPEHDIKR